MSKKVIPFPNKGNHGRRRETKHVVFSLSLMTVLVTAVLMNEKFGQSQRSIYIISDNPNSRIEEMNRAIASGQPMNPFRDIEYEHELAKKLGQEPSVEERSPAAISQDVTSMDQLRFGLLAGKYRVTNALDNKEEKILEISFEPSSSGDENPVFLDAQSFLNNYRHLLSVSFETFKATSEKSNHQVYQLLDKGGAIVGEADFSLDEDGRLLQMKILQSSH